MDTFKLVTNLKPTGDQPDAIEALVKGINNNEKFQTLLGVTGSGKTFTISNVIERVNKPTLVLSHNKTLAAQLYGELKGFFPENAVEFFISYYDYYQPEAYVVSSDTYIEKDFSVNDEIDRLRLKATTALIEGRRDVIVVASVSAIYGIGAPHEYAKQVIILKKGMYLPKKTFLNKLVEIFYSRNDVDFTRGKFRVRGDYVDIIPAFLDDLAVRVEFWGDEIESLKTIDPITGAVFEKKDSYVIYPAKYFVSTKEQIKKALKSIDKELYVRLAELRNENKLLEAQRLEQRTKFDIEMIKELGYCSGIENYSRHMDDRPPGSRPYTLFDYFPKDFLLVVDESHVTIPQLRGMYNGDRARKQTLVDFGFRLPSALDNRPMKFEEFENSINQVIFVSATPADYELEKTHGVIVEQVIRPTGLLDPPVVVRPVRNQIDDLLHEVRQRAKLKERVLVTTLTKRMAEDLTDYFDKLGVKVRYIHSDIDSLERVEILRNLRLGDFDVLVGVNLLREGLDLPEVSLVAIIDADKEGFLRSERSLLQTAGRTARNVNGMVIMYADKITDSMKKVIDETERRREKQMEYNRLNNITPKTVYKTMEEILTATSVADVRKGKEDYRPSKTKSINAQDVVIKHLTKEQRIDLIEQLTEEMYKAAKEYEFERAASIRDEIYKLKELN